MNFITSGLLKFLSSSFEARLLEVQRVFDMHPPVIQAALSICSENCEHDRDALSRTPRVGLLPPSY